MATIPRMQVGVNLPNPTNVASLATIISAFFSPIKAMNIPIPAEIENRIFLGILSKMSSRILKKVIRMKITPSASIMANACCHV